jgi:hypothetical protein
MRKFQINGAMRRAGNPAEESQFYYITIIGGDKQEKLSAGIIAQGPPLYLPGRFGYR